MPASVKLSVEAVGFQQSLEKQIAAATRGQGLKIPLDTRNLADFNSQLDRATQRVVTLGSAFSILATANRGIRELVNSTVQVEKSLTSVNAIFRLTDDNLNKFSSSLFDIARETASSFNDVAKAATEFARQGLSVVETQKAVRAALLLSRDANLDVEESVKAITSATNSFNKEALSRIQIVNRLASVDAAFAVSSKDLSEALIRTGSAAADAGVNFNQFIGLVTAAQQVSQRGGTVIAGALNTIFTRINRKDTLEALDSLGVAITDVRGQALPTIQVLQNFASAYDKMTGSIKNQAAELVGGVRQLNTLKATLQDLSQGENSVFQQVQRVINQSSNEIERRNAARNTTLAALGSQASTTGGQIASNIGNVGIAGAAKSIVGGFITNPVVQALTEANGSAETAGGKLAESVIKGFGSTIVFGLAPIVLKVLGEVGKRVVSNVGVDIAAITGLNSEEQKRAAIEQEINALYKVGGVALQQQLATMTAISEQAAYVRNLLGGAAAPGGVSTSALAGALYSQGYRRTPRGADGYLPIGAEAGAIAAGVGGAPSAARPVYLPHFNRPDGQGIVANTSEFIVPGAAGGYPAIYNRDMIKRSGLPAGAMPVAAGGFIPNAANNYNVPPSYRSGPDQPVYAFGVNPNVFPPNSFPSVGVSAPAQGQGFGQLLGLQKAVVEKEKENADFAARVIALQEVTAKGEAEMLTAEKIRQNNEARIFRNGTNKFGQKATPPNIPIPFEDVGSGTREYAFEPSPSRRISPGSLTYQAYGAYGPNRPPAGPSLYRRLSQRASTFQGTLALGLGLPFLGGLIDDGAGGTSAGVGRGAAKGALQGAGTGATIGSFFGPEGALPGAIIGGVFGGLTGAINKASKSFEELSSELDQKTKRLNEDLTNASSVFRIQADLKDALVSGNQEQVIDLKKQRASALARVNNPLYRDIINRNLGTPEQGSVELARAANNVLIPNATKSNLFSSLSRGQLNPGDVISKLFGGEPITQGFNESGISAVQEAIGGFSRKDLLSLHKTAATNLPAALEQVAQAAGLGPEQTTELVNRLKTRGFSQTSATSLTQNSIFGAINNLLLKEPIPASRDSDIVGRERDLVRQSAALRRGASFSSLEGNANLSIQQVRDQIDLATPGLTDYSRLFRQGRQGTDRIAAQSALQESVLLQSGKAGLIDIAAKTGTNQNVFNTLKGINSLAGLQSFKSELFDPTGAPISSGQSKYPFLTDPKNGFAKALDDLENQLVENQKAAEENTRANEVNTDAQLKQLDFLKSLPAVRANLVTNLSQSRDSQRTQDQAIIDIAGNPETSSLISGNTLSSAKVGQADRAGAKGNSVESFARGFGGVFAGAKQDIKQFAEVGVQVADTLKNSFAGAFGDFVTGAKKAKDAFRDFIVSVLAESARAFATKAVVSLLGALFGNIGGGYNKGSVGVGTSTTIGGGEFATGGFISRASGGGIPTMLTGGEFVYPPAAASRIGGRMLKAVNSGSVRAFAPGGLVRGGSGVADDVFQPLAAGSFVVRRAMVERYGANKLASLAVGGMPDDAGATTLHFATGGSAGSVSSMMTPPTPVLGAPANGGGVFTIGVNITDNSTTTTSSPDQGSGSVADKNFGATLARRIKETTLQVLQEQQRVGGILRPQSQVFPS